MSKKERETSKRQAVREARQRRQRQKRLATILGISAVALVILGLLVVPGILLRRQIVTPEVNPRPMAEFTSMGDPNAPVKIVEYSDFQCPFCKQFSDETEQSIVENYVATGKVHFTYVSFGFAGNGAFPGPESEDAAHASLCAAEQGKFWEYHDILFANLAGENVGSYSEARLMAFAETLDLNMGDFRSCFNNKEYAGTIQEGIQQGLEAGVTATPSFTINGKLVRGAQGYSVFQQEIEAALANAGATQ